MYACDSEFLYHAPCENCGSSDANSVYSDGHSYCFSCGHTVFNNDTNKEVEVSDGNLIASFPKALSKRKITLKTCEFTGYGVGNWYEKSTGKIHTVQVETFYKNNQPVAQHLRLPNKDFRWIGDAKGVGFYGQHLWRKGGRIVVVTEGAIDMLSIIQVTDHKIPVVSLPSGSKTALNTFKRELEWVNSFDKVVLAFDNDEPGQEALHKVAEILPVGKAYTLPMGDFKDANEVLQAGQGMRLVKGVYEPKEYRPDGIISGGELWDSLIEEIAPGLELPFPILNRKLSGLRPAQLILITAGSGIGKTTIAREIGYHLLMHHKQTLGVMALEENKRKTAKYWAGLYLNKLIHVDISLATQKELKEAFEAVLNNGRFYLYDHWGSTAINNLLAKINYMAVSLGCQFIILDHISIVVSDDDEGGESERKTIDRLMTRLRTLINATGVGIIAIVHLKRPPGDQSYNTGKAVSLSDLRGSGSLEQLSDVVISAERDQQGDNPNQVLLRLLKDRDKGETGKADLAEYNPNTGRIVAISSEIQAAFKGSNFNEDF